MEVTFSHFLELTTFWHPVKPDNYSIYQTLHFTPKKMRRSLK